MGYNSGWCNKNGRYNIFIGDGSGFFNVGGTRNLCMGHSSGYNSTASDNIYIGYVAGYTNTLGTNNLAIGNYSGAANSIGIDNLFIGNYSGWYNTASHNMFIGYQSGKVNTVGSSNLFIGDSSGVQNTLGSSNLFIGSNSGAFNTIGMSNLFIGNNAGANNISGSGNTFLGVFSGSYNSSGNDNFMCGNFAGGLNTSGHQNIYLGLAAGQSCTGSQNTYIGTKVGQGNVGSNSVFLGYETGLITPSAFSNKLAIYSAANGITSNTTAGTCNILIGGDFTSGRVGIGTLNPDSFVGSNIHVTDTVLVVLGKVLANAYTLFTGTHKINLDNTINPNDLQLGMLMSANGTAIALDVNNSVVTVCISAKPNDKTIYGAYSGSENTTIDNIDTGIPTTNTTYYANAVGEGSILVSNYAGEIQNGDYITSCIIPGYGALQTDDILHSYTAAKCTQNIDWSSISANVLCTVDGIMYKSLLVACTYHCG